MHDEPTYFIAMFSPSRETFPGDAKPQEIAEVNKHFEELKVDHAAGNLILAGRTLDHNPVGICVFKAESQQAAEERMAEDAAIKSGIFKLIWIRPYSVALLGSA
jgi:uncharacterized protein YciI